MCNELKNVKFSPKKMWYICSFIRGLSVEEALKQLQCIKSKGALVLIDFLKETIDLGVNEHNVEFRSNLWVCKYLKLFF